jgi:hypothetical protein
MQNLLKRSVWPTLSSTAALLASASLQKLLLTTQHGSSTAQHEFKLPMVQVLVVLAAAVVIVVIEVAVVVVVMVVAWLGKKDAEKDQPVRVLVPVQVQMCTHVLVVAVVARLQAVVAVVVRLQAVVDTDPLLHRGRQHHWRGAKTVVGVLQPRRCQVNECLQWLQLHVYSVRLFTMDSAVLGLAPSGCSCTCQVPAFHHGFFCVRVSTIGLQLHV